MDTKFQTSFIPKKPILAEQKVVRGSSGISIFMFVSILIFSLSLAGAVGTLLWKNILIKNQESYRKDLIKAENEFDTVTIEKLKKINTKIDLSKKLLASHVSVSEIFPTLAALTIESVKFNSFSFASPSDSKGGLKITLKGIASNFSAVAFQSSVFGKSDKFGKNRSLKDPVISDLVVDEFGNVGFSFSATLNTGDLLYSDIIDPGSKSKAVEEVKK